MTCDRVDALVKKALTNMPNDNVNNTACPINIHLEVNPLDFGGAIIWSSSSIKVEPKLSDVDDRFGDTSWNFEPNFSRSLMGSYFALMIATTIPSRKFKRFKQR